MPKSFHEEACEAVGKLDDEVQGVKVTLSDSPTASDAAAMMGAVVVSGNELSDSLKIKMIMSVCRQIYRRGYLAGTEAVQIGIGVNHG